MIDLVQSAKVCSLNIESLQIKIFGVKSGMCTHLAESTETRPSFGPSFSRITEWGHLYRVKVEDDGTDKKDLTYFHVSIRPGS